MGTTSLGRARRQGSAILFTATTFLASALLFAVQPMVTRMLLPQLGGSAAAWNTAMVFFQSTLLLGYVAAHLSIRRLGVRRHTWVQLAALALAAATLPVALPDDWVAPITSGTEWWTLTALAVMVGAPFVVLATSSPTLQRWFAATDHPRAADPYFLYAAGNAGSLLALLAYPLALERVLGVGDQARLWSGGFVLLGCLTALCALVTRRDGAAKVAPESQLAPVRWFQPRWIAWAAVPSALLLGTTRHLATDVASIPLLWVVPLALYLATFIVAFGRWGAGARDTGAALAAIVVVPAVLAWVGGSSLRAAPLLLHLLALTAVALLAHGRLAADRPPAQDLTGFYVALSVGGAIGGVLAALVAPLVFDRIYEYPLALAAGLTLVPRSTLRMGTAALGRWLRQPATIVGLAALAVGGLWAMGGVEAVALVAIGAVSAIAASRLPIATGVGLAVATLVVVQGGAGAVIYSERTFFGVSRVERATDGSQHVLVSGTTVHGRQSRSPGQRNQPSTYYVEEGPAGQILREYVDGGATHVGVVGLGAGELATYLGADDSMVFYEIDPAVVRIASDPAFFSYLSDAAGEVSVQTGDGRLLVERTDRLHDVLAIDAFSSDAIPVHLLTREAMATYAASLAPGGVIIVHVTNQYFGLVPAVTAIGEANGLTVRARHFSPAPGAPGVPSSWVALAPGDLPAVTEGLGWFEPSPGPVWTDDRADLLGALAL